MATNSVPGPTVARVLRHAGDAGAGDVPPASGRRRRQVAPRGQGRRRRGGRAAHRAASAPGLTAVSTRRSSGVGFRAHAPPLPRPIARTSLVGRPSRGVADRARHPLLRSGQLDPRRPERALVLVEAERRFAVCRGPPGTHDVHATQVHLRAALGEGQLDRPPPEEVHRARMVPATLGDVARVRRGEAAAVTEEDEAAQDRPHRRRPRAPRGRRGGPPQRTQPPRDEPGGAAQGEADAGRPVAWSRS